MLLSIQLKLRFFAYGNKITYGKHYCCPTGLEPYRPFSTVFKGFSGLFLQIVLEILRYGSSPTAK